MNGEMFFFNLENEDEGKEKKLVEFFSFTFF